LLIELAGHVAKLFDASETERNQEILLVKSASKRDVVSRLDLEISQFVEKYLTELNPNARVISEENTENVEEVWGTFIKSDQAYLIDPLDGSSNYSSGFSEYGFMGCYQKKGRFVESLVVLPNESMVIHWKSGGQNSFSRQVSNYLGKFGPAYVAYSPIQSDSQLRDLTQVLDFADKQTAGFFRYGSACTALYRTLLEFHPFFLGLNMRPWDVASYFPILAAANFQIRYASGRCGLSMLATKEPRIIESFNPLAFSQFQNSILYREGDELRITDD
jgi:myo-inositol-1(or 4)-monophosphatase